MAIEYNDSVRLFRDQNEFTVFLIMKTRKFYIDREQERLDKAARVSLKNIQDLIDLDQSF